MGWLSPLEGYGVRAPGDPRASAIVDGLAPTLEVASSFAEVSEPGVTVALRDSEGALLASLDVTERMERAGRWRLRGRVTGIEEPAHAEAAQLHLSPTLIAERAGGIAPRVLAFYAGDVLHAGLRAALVDAARRLDAAIVILVPSGSSDTDTWQDGPRMRALRVSAAELPTDRTVLAIAPMSSASALECPERAALMAVNCGASAIAVDVTDTDAATVERLAVASLALGIDVVRITPWSYDAAAGRLIRLCTCRVSIR